MTSNFDILETPPAALSLANEFWDAHPYNLLFRMNRNYDWLVTNVLATYSLIKN